MPPARVTVPEQLVLVAVMVLEVEPKAERQADEPGALGAPVTVKPTGKVTVRVPVEVPVRPKLRVKATPVWPALRDRKSIRLNSSHGYISYAVFCLKKKK